MLKLGETGRSGKHGGRKKNRNSRHSFEGNHTAHIFDWLSINYFFQWYLTMDILNAIIMMINFTEIIRVFQLLNYVGNF